MKIDFSQTIFKKVNGDQIPECGQYIIDYLKNIDPNVKIMIGCDSVNIRRGTMYVVTVVFYNELVRKGAHYISYKHFIRKEKDVFTRLYSEATTLYDFGNYLEDKLKGHYFPKSYIFDIKGRLIENIYGHFPNEYDGSKPSKLCEIHVDFNRHAHTAKKHKYRGMILQENKSHDVYQATMGMLCGDGFKVRAKPISMAATSAADFQCH